MATPVMSLNTSRGRKPATPVTDCSSHHIRNFQPYLEQILEQGELAGVPAAVSI